MLSLMHAFLHYQCPALKNDLTVQYTRQHCLGTNLPVLCIDSPSPDSPISPAEQLHVQVPRYMPRSSPTPREASDRRTSRDQDRSDRNIVSQHEPPPYHSISPAAHSHVDRFHGR